MSNLKQKQIGRNSVVLKPVPARDARKMQMHLAALLAEPLAKALPNETKATAEQTDLSKMANGLVMGASAFASLFAKLDDGDADKLIEQAAAFILINGEALNENVHFSADTLFDLYETVWFFYTETFTGFFGAIRSRFPQLAKLKLSQFKAPTSTGISGDPA